VLVRVRLPQLSDRHSSRRMLLPPTRCLRSDMRTGEMKDRHEYLVEKFPERPWNAAEHS